jgi:SAM-dependent methyltransferase
VAPAGDWRPASFAQIISRTPFFCYKGDLHSRPTQHNKEIQVKTSRLLVLCLAFAVTPAPAQDAAKPAPGLYEPTIGQEGKDVVWVPTPDVLVEKMLDLAKVTAEDYVMDLGSGDGRNIIAAAKRGARGRGVEYNPDMVELSKSLAEKAGVADKAEFVQGDMFEADISSATVMALFLLPDNLSRLIPKFIDLKPGTRMVLNGFAVPGWDPDLTERADGDCGSWCTAYLYFVPAKVAGTWQLPKGKLVLEQTFQKVTGKLSRGGQRMDITGGLLKGDVLTFTAGGTRYEGRVNGETMSGIGGAWTAKRVAAAPVRTSQAPPAK